MGKQQKAGVVWVSVWRSWICISRRRPTWNAACGWWYARDEEDMSKKVFVSIFGLKGLKSLHAYRVDLIKALDGKPFILETLKPPKGK